MVDEQLSPNDKWVAVVTWAGATASILAGVGRRDTSPPSKRGGGLVRRLAEHPESAEKLRSLVKAALMYANDYDDKLPDTLEGVSSKVSRTDMNGLRQISSTWARAGPHQIDPQCP